MYHKGKTSHDIITSHLEERGHPSGNSFLSAGGGKQASLTLFLEWGNSLGDLCWGWNRNGTWGWPWIKASPKRRHSVVVTFLLQNLTPGKQINILIFGKSLLSNAKYHHTCATALADSPCQLAIEARLCHVCRKLHAESFSCLSISRRIPKSQVVYNVHLLLRYCSLFLNLLQSICSAGEMARLVKCLWCCHEKLASDPPTPT